MIELCYLTVMILTKWQNFGNCSDGLNELTKNLVSEHAWLGGGWLMVGWWMVVSPTGLIIRPKIASNELILGEPGY